MVNYKEILNDIVRSEENLREITQDEKMELKKCLYDMACDIDNKCREHNIHLFLVGGSLLGAVRHGGFIPWDDDMDFALIRGDYERLISVFDEVLGREYELRCPNSKFPNGNRFMQIYKKNTVLKTLGGNNPMQPQCVSIDVFPYDYVPQNKICRFVRGIYANIMMAIASCVMEKKYPDELLLKYMKKHKNGKKLCMLRNIIGVFFSFKSPEKWFNKVDDIIAYKRKSDLVTSATGRKHYFGEVYKYGVFFPLTEMKFNGHLFYAPCHYEIYLKGLYGSDYMIPPKNDGKESHFISELKL